MSRRSLILVACCPMVIPFASTSAQEPLEAQSASPPERIDILVDTATSQDDYEDCEEDQDAATITGEIIVCRKRGGDENRLYNKEEAERRHAEETAFKKDPKTPDFILDCNDQGWPPGCVRMGSVPPPAYLIDFDALPDTPAGSDADRVAQGLAPRGYLAGPDGAVVVAGAPTRQSDAEVLGLPPALNEEEVNPSESASPAEEPSG